MTKNQIIVGGTYIARVKNKSVRVKVEAIREYDPNFNLMTLSYDSASRRIVSSYRGKPAQTRYECTNLTTGNSVILRSADKFCGY